MVKLDKKERKKERWKQEEIQNTIDDIEKLKEKIYQNILRKDREKANKGKIKLENKMLYIKKLYIERAKKILKGRRKPADYAVKK